MTTIFDSLRYRVIKWHCVLWFLSESLKKGNRLPNLTIFKDLTYTYFDIWMFQSCPRISRMAKTAKMVMKCNCVLWFGRKSRLKPLFLWYLYWWNCSDLLFHLLRIMGTYCDFRPNHKTQSLDHHFYKLGHFREPKQLWVVFYSPTTHQNIKMCIWNDLQFIAYFESVSEKS